MRALKFLVYFLLPISFLIGNEQIADLEASINNHSNVPALSLSYRTSLKQHMHSCLINPVIIYKNPQEQGVSLGIGYRRATSAGVVGVHVYEDYAYVSRNHFFQFSPTLELLRHSFEVKCSGYFPLQGSKDLATEILMPVSYADAEFTYKTRYVHAGMGAVFNFNTKDFGLTGKLALVLECFTMILSGGYDPAYQNHVKLSLNLALFGKEYNLHDSKVRRNHGIVFTRKPLLIKEKVVYVEPFYPDLPKEIAVIEPIVDENPPIQGPKTVWATLVEESNPENPNNDGTGWQMVHPDPITGEPNPQSDSWWSRFSKHIAVFIKR